MASAEEDDSGGAAVRQGRTEDPQCCVCYVPTGVFTPCAHPLCERCQTRLQEPVCPLCRRELQPRGEQQERTQESSAGSAAGSSPTWQQLPHGSWQGTPARRAGSRRSAAAELFAEWGGTRAGGPHRTLVEAGRARSQPSSTLPDGPLSNRPYQRRLWTLVGLPEPAGPPVAAGSEEMGRLPAPVRRHAAPSRARSPHGERPDPPLRVLREAAGGSSSSTSVVRRRPVSLPREEETGLPPPTPQQPKQRQPRQHQWRAWSLPGLPNASAVAKMGAEQVVEQARSLSERATEGQQATGGGSAPRRAMAQALAQRARQLSRTSKNLAGGVLELQSAMRALHDARLLPEDEASVLPFIDRRISEILRHEGELLARRPGRPQTRLRSTAASSSGTSAPALAQLPTAPAVFRPEDCSALDSRWWGLVNEREQRRPTSV